MIIIIMNDIITETLSKDLIDGLCSYLPGADTIYVT